ncbi:MAG: hypothetical protein WC881_00410 [Elusimicrobiota bacterium]|jgi:hypothetical protein
MRNIWFAVMLWSWWGAPVQAQDKNKWDSLTTYFKNLKQGLTDSSVEGQYQRGRGTVVAAVRGQAQDDGKAELDKPLMKDPAQERKRKQERAERREFEKAVDLINEGKLGEGIAALEAFEKAHPKSARLAEVREARAKALELKEAQKAEAVTSEAAKPETAKPDPAAPAPAPAMK